MHSSCIVVLQKQISGREYNRTTIKSRGEFSIVTQGRKDEMSAVSNESRTIPVRHPDLSRIPRIVLLVS